MPVQACRKFFFLERQVSALLEDYSNKKKTITFRHWQNLTSDCLQHFLGHFKSEEEGARAYDRALLTRKKKDGCFNFPLSDYQQTCDADEGCKLPIVPTAKQSAAGMHNQGLF